MGNKTKSTRNKPRPTANGIPERRAMSRRAADQEVIRREEWFRSLIENSLDAIVVLNGDGTPRYTSPSSERLLGYGPEELNGKKAVENVHPDDMPMATEAFAQLVDDPSRTLHTEVRSRHKDGSWLTLEVVGRNLLDDPRVNGIVVNYRDITERKQAEEVLRKSEENFRLLVSEVEDYAIFMLDPDGRVASWNEGARHIKGYSHEEIIGKHFSCFYAKEDIEAGKPDRELKTATAQGRFEDEGWRVRKDGSQFLANAVITAFARNCEPSFRTRHPSS